MKKIILIFFLLIFTQSSFASQEIGKNENFKFRKLTIDLASGGGWRVIGSHTKTVDGIIFTAKFLAQIKENKLSRLVELLAIDNFGNHPALANAWLYELLYKANKGRGCYKRLEYYIFKVYKKGKVSNCFIVRNWEVHKELYNPSMTNSYYVDMNYAPRIMRSYMTNNNIEIPLMMLRSEHYYYTGGKLFWVFRMIDPEIDSGPKTKFNKEETSEYFPSNISKYPDKKKYMEKWVNLAVHRHKNFEKQIKILDRQKLNFDEYDKSISLVKKNDEKNLTKELRELTEMYKEGTLTKKQFEKAKELLLNN